MLKNETSSLRITLDILDDMTMRIVKTETIVKDKNSLTERQLNFKRDDTKQLITKLKSKRYSNYRDDIFEILMKRYNKSKQNLTEINKKNRELISVYLFDCIMKSTEIKKVA